MPEQKGILTRLRVAITPQFIEDWTGKAGTFFRTTLQKLSRYNEDTLKIEEKASAAPDLAWKKVEGASVYQHAQAEASYAKAETDRMELELRRRTFEDKVRQEHANADKAETEVKILQLREMEARLELFQKLQGMGVAASLTLEGGMNIQISPITREATAVDPLRVFDAEELGDPAMVTVRCPNPEIGPGPFNIFLARFAVLPGQHVKSGDAICELRIGTHMMSPLLLVRSPVDGVVVKLYLSIGDETAPDAELVTILPKAAGGAG